MDVNELIVELQKQQAKGYGELKVKYDYGAYEVEAVLHSESNLCSDEYIRLNDIAWD